jgi:hypothetical protein
MEAIRQTVKVKNHQIKISLPADFNSEEVEVIIIAKNDDFVLTNEMKLVLDERANEDRSTFIDAEESLKRLKARKYV